MRIGVIDIGSNSVRLYIASVNHNEITPIFNALNTTRLYENMMDNQTLHQDSMVRTIEGIQQYCIQAQEYDVDQLYCFATAAVRVASNGASFVRLVDRQCSIRVDVLSEEREAQMAYWGVDALGVCGIVDIGGASTEVAIGSESGIDLAVSSPIGAVKGKEQYPFKHWTYDGIQKVQRWASTYIENRKAQSNKVIPKAVQWYGVGGTITTIAAIKNKMERYDPIQINQTIIDKQDVIDCIEMLACMTDEQRMAVEGLPAKRADIILYGLIILDAVMHVYNIKSLRSSDNGNLVGYIRSLYPQSHIRINQTE